jgi:biotin-dependent carboxylase-like uncharacterized protein
MAHLVVVRAGALTTVQDLGRPGLAHLGVPRSGAADRASSLLANRLVGNGAGAAVLEVTLGGLQVTADAPLSVAITGAAGPVTVDGAGVGRNAVVALPAGATLALGTATAGLRSYVAVRGGVDVPAELGSRSTDTLSGLGPAAVRDGDRLPVGAEWDRWPTVDLAPVAPLPAPDGAVWLDLLRGPRADRLAAGELDRMALATWTVAAASDRVGIRLEGPALALAVDREWPSEGTVRGAVQLPPGGRPVVFLADHPVTGGYPVIAVLAEPDADRAAQLRPGQPVRFHLRHPPQLRAGRR